MYPTDNGNRYEGLDSNNGEPYPKKRPTFGPTQVRYKKSIKPGKYVRHHKHSSYEITVTGLKKLALGWVAETPERHHYLSDMSVMSYEGGTWNPVNWLERKDSQDA